MIKMNGECYWNQLNVIWIFFHEKSAELHGEDFDQFTDE
jgi:hypothetical protein